MKKPGKASRQPQYRSTTLRVVPRRPIRRQQTQEESRAVASAPSVSSAQPPVGKVHSSSTRPNSPPAVAVANPHEPKRQLTQQQKHDSGEKLKKNTTIPQKKKTKKPRGKKLALQMYVMAGLVLVVGGALAYQAYHTNTLVEKQVTELKQQTAVLADAGSSNLPPNEEKPKDSNYIQNYKVAPLVPRTITIKKIGVYARILQVGTDAQGRMDVPKTAYDTAWYTGSSRPGEQGAMVIDAHVMSIGGLAVFSNLKKLAAGDTISIVRGDGKEFHYTVVQTEQTPVDRVNMGKLLVSHDSTKPGLNLITCGGKYDAETASFDDRTIVYAVQP